MKLVIYLIFFQMLFPLLSSAQSAPYNVVFDITSKDSADQKAVVRWLKAISESNSSAQLEVVLYGQSLDMITQGKSTVASDVTGLLENKNVSFKVCEIALKHHNLRKEQLLAGVQTVPDGIYEIITKQGNGWGYIKVSH